MQRNHVQTRGPPIFMKFGMGVPCTTVELRMTMGFLYSLLLKIGVVHFKMATVISCLLDDDGVNNCTSKTVGPVKRSTA